MSVNCNEACTCDMIFHSLGNTEDDKAASSRQWQEEAHHKECHVDRNEKYLHPLKRYK